MRSVILGVLLCLAGAGAAWAEKYAPTITPYVETAAQQHQMTTADAAFDKGDYETVKRLLAPLIEAGHPKAINYTGLMHNRGLGYTKNTKRACKLYEIAALRGYASAQWNTSTCYHLAGKKNEMKRKYHFWIETAAQNGIEEAQAHMAAYYYKTNRKLFLYWAKKAAAQGNIFARILLSRQDHGHLFPDLTLLDTACVIVMIGVLGKDLTYCN